MSRKAKEKMKNFLERLMEFLGGLLEKILGQAKKAKGTYEKKAGLQPILSLESRLPLPKLKNLMGHFAERFFPPALSQLKDKTVLEIGEDNLKFQKIILEKKPKVYCGVMVGEGSATGTAQQNFPLVLRGSFRSIPFEDQFFDCVACRLATPHQGDVISAFKELARVLLPGGEGLIVDYHPFGLFAKSGKERLRSVQSTLRGVEDYFKMCRLSGLAVEDLHEGFIDDTLRNQFTTTEEMSTFREIKGTPLVIFLRVVKQRKK